MNSRQILPISYITERLEVIPFNDAVDVDSLVYRTMEMLSPEVTQSLPPGWQSIETKEKALNWINERTNESTVLLILSNSEVIGFIFLFIDDESSDDALALRFGYLLAKESWGKGIGTEVLTGLIEWANINKGIKSISGGVEKSNIGSIRVLEKVGFEQLSEETSDTLFFQYSFQ